MDIDTAIRTQRAIRTFSDDPVSDEQLRPVLEAGRRAQSSKNTQPWTFVVVRSRETLHALSECGPYAGHLAGAAVGVALVSERPAGFDLGQAAGLMQLVAHAHGLGSCIASMYDQDRARAILGIPAGLEFEQALSFGWPTPEAQDRPMRRGGRRPIEEVVRYERYG